MKDSGNKSAPKNKFLGEKNCDWIGEKIPKKWKISQIRYLYKLRSEKNYKPLEEVNLISLYTDKGVIQHSDLEQTTGNRAVTADGYKLVYPDDIVVNIILCWMGAIGRSEYQGVTSPAYDVYEPIDKNNVCSRYYHYLFRTDNFAVKCYTLGRGIMMMRWRTYSSEFRSIKVPVPPIDEQKKIADYLDNRCSKIDELITGTTASIEDYKKLKQSIITEAVTKGLNKDVPMKDTGIDWIGEIPKEWKKTILRRYCSFKTGKTPSTSVPEWFDGDVNWFTPGDFNENYYLIDSKRKLSAKAIDDSVAISIPKDCVMIIGIGSVGKVGITNIPCSCNQQITAILSSIMYPKYLMYFLELSGKILKETEMFTILPILNNDTLGNSPLIVPPLSEQKEIANYLDKKVKNIDDIINEKTGLIEDLKAYKKSLIYEVVTGKKEVK